MQWEVVIGLETHTQLTTASKIFSGAPIVFGAAPNTQACPVDLALPGVLPVLNRGAVERAIQFGLAIGATIAPRSTRSDTSASTGEPSKLTLTCSISRPGVVIVFLLRRRDQRR